MAIDDLVEKDFMTPNAVQGGGCANDMQVHHTLTAKNFYFKTAIDIIYF
jgi:hypothetical protein